MPGRNRNAVEALAYIILAIGNPVIAVIDGSNTEVSAEVRLRDYLAQSQYPPTNQALPPGYAELDKTPLLPGDQRHAGQVLGFTDEKIQAGSLVIRFKVRIDCAGSYSFRTFLLNSSRERGIQAMNNIPLKTGEHHLTFVFYGKAIRDILGKGSYYLPGILAEKLPDDGGDSGALSGFMKMYQTRAYDTKLFTDKPWDAPEKQARIRELKREMEKPKK